MRRRQFLASAIPLALAGHAAVAGTGRKLAVSAAPAAVDAVVERFLAGGFGVGVSVAALRAGQLQFAKGYGLANLETSTPVTPASVFLAASITKQFTAAAVMRLVEAGKVDLDAPVSTYISEMASVGPITARMMLHQTSGLHNYSGREFSQQQKIDRTSKEMLDYILAQPTLIDFAPGERFDYSNSNYFILGVIAERVSGRPLAALLDDLIDAAGLSRTAADRSFDVVPHRASGYSLIDGNPGQWRKAEYFSMDNAGGAGVLRSTPTDLVKWHQALFDGLVVREASLREMIATGRLNSGAPILRDNPPLGGESPAYGFGLEAGQFDGRRTVGHAGSVPGYTAYVVTFPDERLSLAMMINADPGPQLPFIAMIRAILGAPHRPAA